MTSQLILTAIGSIVVAGMGLIMVTVIKNFVTLQQKKITSFFDKVEDQDQKHKECQLRQEHLNVPKIKEDVEYMKSMVLSIVEMKKLFERQEERQTIANNTVIQFSEKVNGIDELLKQNMSNQEEHFAMLESVFSQKVSSIMQEHLSTFRVEIRDDFEKVHRELALHNKDIQSIYQRLNIIEAMKK